MCYKCECFGGSNCDTFKQASGSNPDKFRITRGLKDVPMRIS